MDNGWIAVAGVTCAVVLATPCAAEAFCGFYVSSADGTLENDATMVVLMRSGTRTVVSMQNDYVGPPEDFVMVVPVPVVLREGMVRTLPPEVFERVDRLAAPRLVEYWEQDPCSASGWEIDSLLDRALGGGPRDGFINARRSGVRVEAQFAVGEYDVQILSADDSNGLERWLRAERYRVPAGAGEILRPYVEQGTKFFVAKVDVDRVTFEDGRARLSPLRFHYDSPRLALPIRLGLLNSSGKQDLIVHVLSPRHRYEVANHPNVTIPTNVRVTDEVRGRFGSFYASLLDRTLERNPGAVVTEYAWNAGGCDPCPTPPLSAGDLATLGADVLPSGARRGLPRFVLTRLHYRYDDRIDDDLVFRTAPPIQGGRGMPDPAGALDPRVSPSPVDAFQARYVMLERWEGEPSCDAPRRGRWGGPPGARGRAPGVTPAVDTAHERRRDLPLERLIVDPLAALGVAPEADLDAARLGSPAWAEASHRDDKREIRKRALERSRSTVSLAATVPGSALLVALVAVWWRARRRA